jgi:hypothetical protein
VVGKESFLFVALNPCHIFEQDCVVDFHLSTSPGGSGPTSAEVLLSQKTGHNPKVELMGWGRVSQV